MQDGSDEHVSKQPLVVNGMGVGVRGVGEPERLGDRGALGVGLMEGGVEVRQQLVAHAQRSPPSFCHQFPLIQLLHESDCNAGIDEGLRLLRHLTLLPTCA